MLMLVGKVSIMVNTLWLLTCNRTMFSEGAPELEVLHDRRVLYSCIGVDD